MSEEDIGYLMKLIHFAIRADADKNLREFDLTLSQTRVLTYLTRQEGRVAPQKEIEANFRVAHPTMVGLLHRLESKGFIRVQVNRDDRRMKDIALTREGEQAAACADKHRRRMEEAMTSGLSSGERKQLASLLHRVYEGIVETSGGEPELWRPNKKEEAHD